VTEGTGTVKLTNITVVDATTITATVKPSDDSTAEQATVTATNPASGGGPAPPPATYSATILPIPKIQWKGNPISGNGAKTQKVKVGQPVELTTTPATLTGGYTISQSTWNIDGATIKSYTANNSGITIQETDLDTQNTTFYWLYPDTGFNVTYDYCASDPNGNALCTSPQAKATFNAIEPNALLSTWDSKEATIEQLTNCANNAKVPYLGYGNLSGPIPECQEQQNGTPGIKLTASGASGGKYVFVQLINSDSRTYTSAAGSYTCTTVPNLDTRYPYPPYSNEPNVAPDGPEIPLPSINISGERNFLATMYLLWQPDKLGGSSMQSIPVPIGHQQWAFSAKADQKQPIGNGKWKTPEEPNAHGDTGAYAASYDGETNLHGYPVWNDVATETCP
jgi:hypothetical protein